MLRTSERKFLEKLLLLAVALTSVIVTPKSAGDPINPIKMAVIAVCGFACAGFIASYWRKIFQSPLKLLMILSGLFLISLILNLIFAGGNLTQKFFGVYGRNTGFVTYASLLLLLVGGAIASSSSLIKKFTLTMLAVGVLSSIYGYMQHSGIDPAGWVSPYSPIMGFLGNPDFAAAFLALTCIAALAPILSKGAKVIFKISSLIYIVLALYLIKLSGVKQGILIFVIGIVCIVILILYHSKFKVLSYLAIIGAISTVTFVLFALFNIGPLASLLYKTSLTARGYYWQAGLTMITDHPFLGVGLDNYGDWYRRSRSIDAYNWSPTQYTNAAHNVFIDIAANGGLILLIIMLGIMALVIKSIIQFSKHEKVLDPYFAILVSLWVAFNAQLLISINQIGVAVWGWVISGLIIGHGHSGNLETKNESIRLKKSRNETNKTENFTAKALILFSIGSLIGLGIGLPDYVGESRYYIEMSSGDPIRIQKAAYIWPQNAYHFLQVSVTLRDNRTNTSIAHPELKVESIPDYANLGLTVARDAVRFFPDSIDTWKLLRSFPKITNQEDILTKKKMKELDPIAYAK